MGLILDRCETDGKQNAQKHVALSARQHLPWHRSTGLEEEPGSKPVENGKAVQTRIQLLPLDLASALGLTVDQAGADPEERVHFHY